MLKRTSWDWGWVVCCPSAHEAGPEFPPCDKWRSLLFSLAPVNWITQDVWCTGSGNPQAPTDRRERARWRSGAPSNFEAVIDMSGPAQPIIQTILYTHRGNTEHQNAESCRNGMANEITWFNILAWKTSRVGQQSITISNSDAQSYYTGHLAQENVSARESNGPAVY